MLDLSSSGKRSHSCQNSTTLPTLLRASRFFAVEPWLSLVLRNVVFEVREKDDNPKRQHRNNGTRNCVRYASGNGSRTR